MEQHSPQSDPLADLESSSPEKGDVVLCGAFAGRGPALSEFDDDRVSFVAPLGSRSDLESLLRALHRHPNVRHLVLCGDDVKVAGEALVALWQAGLDENGRLADSRGRLCAGLDGTSVDALRSDVKVWDWRGRALGELAGAIRDLPALPPERRASAQPGPGIPKRKVFLSRKTSFPIFSRDVGDSWLQLLNLVLRIGTEKKAAGGETVAEALNAVVTIGLPVIAEDLEVEVAAPETFPSFLDFNREDFERHYGAAEAPAMGRWQQLLDVDAGSMAMLEPHEMSALRIAPDLISATFNVVDGSLYGSFVLRSVDVYTDWPLEAMSLTRLLGEVAGQLAIEVGAATFVIHSAQLPAHDWERVQHVLEESFRRPLPLQVDHSGVFLFGNDGGQARAMLLDHDAGTIFWEEAFSSPQELSWYIVDAMPWLLPQHIRYVGQECATLMRAMQESECYLQG